MKIKNKIILGLALSSVVISSGNTNYVSANQTCELEVSEKGKKIKADYISRIEKMEEELSKRLKSESVLRELKDFRKRIEGTFDCVVGNSPSFLDLDINGAINTYNSFKANNKLVEVEVTFVVKDGGAFEGTSETTIVKKVEKGNTLEKYGVELPKVIAPKGKVFIGWHGIDGTLFGEEGSIGLKKLPIIDNITFTTGYADKKIEVKLSGDEGVEIESDTIEINSQEKWSEVVKIISNKVKVKDNYKIKSISVQGKQPKDEDLIDDNIKVFIITEKNVELTNESPVINAKDVIVNVGEKFDPLKNVTAIDKEDGEIKLTSENVVENDVDTLKVGKYTVKYMVKDSKGVITEKTINVFVVAKTPDLFYPNINIGNENIDKNKNSNNGTEKVLKSTWLKKEGYWYRFDESGRMLRNEWFNENGKWYRFDESGKMLANQWFKENGKWYRFDESGRMLADEWFNENSKWYWLESSGAMSSNKWIFVNGEWFWASSSGRIFENEWVLYNGKWYYAKSGGFLAKNTVLKINGKKYSFDSTGALR